MSGRESKINQNLGFGGQKSEEEEKERETQGQRERKSQNMKKREKMERHYGQWKEERK